MSKPLELIVYSTWTAVDGTVHCSAFQHEGFPIAVDMVVREKRLTDVELAAEYWRANAVGWMHEDAGMSAASDLDAAEAATWHKFATLPHYDEAPAG